MSDIETELSVVMLCYKGEDQIYNFAAKTIQILDESLPSWELILVGNYWEDTHDKTPEVVRDIASKYSNVKALTLPKQGMMGWDVRSGLALTKGRFICFFDGDGQFLPEDVVRVYNKIKKEKFDFVMTYRVKREDGLLRRVISSFYNVIFRILFPGVDVLDINSKPKIFTREVYNKMDLKADGWFIDAEIVICARRSKLNIGQISTVFYPNHYRESFVGMSAILEFLANLSLARMKEFFR